MTISKFCFSVAAMLTVIAISGCDTNPVKPTSQADVVPKRTAPIQPKETPEQIAQKAARAAAENVVTEGIALYDAGDYNGTIKRLNNATEIRPEDKDLQVRAYKYMAFSYCVTGRQTLCRQQFDKILKLDPTFDLATAEKGHPQWQAAFDRVKKSQK